MSPPAFNAPHSKSDGRGLFIGLMSGTSADGIEASMVSISKSRSKKFPAYRIELIAHRSFPFSEGLRARILGASESPAAGRPRAGQSTAALTSLHYDLGERFAAAAIGVAESAGIPLQKVSAIGSHGQTVCHRPLFGGKVIDATFQIGEPAVIAERTGIMVVGDFRPADVAAGGLGAPLTPYAHGTLFSARDHPVLVVNLGGICNVTWAPAGFSGGRTKALDGLEGFDTGPANMLLDAAVLKYSRGGEGHDRDGGMAARGQVDEKLLCHLIAHPFIRRRPPKATGREDFGARALKEAVEVFLRQRETPGDAVRFADLLRFSGDPLGVHDTLDRQAGETFPAASGRGRRLRRGGEESGSDRRASQGVSRRRGRAVGGPGDSRSRRRSRLVRVAGAGGITRRSGERSLHHRSQAPGGFGEDRLTGVIHPDASSGPTAPSQPEPSFDRIPHANLYSSLPQFSHISCAIMRSRSEDAGGWVPSAGRAPENGSTD